MGDSTGFFRTLLCGLMAAKTIVQTTQNFELCFIPWYVGTENGASAGPPPYFNVESQGSTPEQNGPCGNPANCQATTPAVRVMADSTNTQYATWWIAKTQSVPAQQAQYQIQATPFQYGQAMGDANWWLEHQGYSRCGLLGQGYDVPESRLPDQCVYDFDISADTSAELIALEQAGEGPHLNYAAWSQTGLRAETP